MDFNEALERALKDDKHTHSDPFLLKSRISDLVGNDYDSKEAMEAYFRLDSRYGITNTTLKCAPPPLKQAKKKQNCRGKPLLPPPDNAFVYVDINNRSVEHFSKDCPRLQGKVKLRTLQKYQNKLSHGAAVCRVCGGFSPTYPSTLLERIKLFLSEKFGMLTLFYDLV